MKVCKLFDLNEKTDVNRCTWLRQPVTVRHGDVFSSIRGQETGSETIQLILKNERQTRPKKTP